MAPAGFSGPHPYSLLIIGGFALANHGKKRAEPGHAIAPVADERNGYLAGVDILCDGGSVVGKQFK